MKLITAFVGLAILLSISGCGNIEPAPIDTYTSLTDFQNKRGAPIHTFTFDAATGGTFTTPKGTVIQIPAHAFFTMGGLAAGLVKFEVRDIYSKSDMILSNITTQSYHHPIVSGGEAWFRATQNNQPLYLYGANPITVKMRRDPNAQPMQLYSAIPDTGTTNVNWVTVDTAANPFATEPPIDSSYYWQYELNSAVSGTLDGDWVNCDHPFDSYTSTDLTLNVAMGFSSVTSYLVFDDYNSVVQLYTILGNYTYQFAPLGHNCTLVAYCVQNGKIYASIQPITISANQQVNIHLQQTDAESFEQQLEALN